MDSIGVGLLGCGTVGTGVLRILGENAADIEARLGVPLVARRIAVRSPDKARDPAIPQSLLTQDAERVIDDPEVQVVIEVIGGYEPARTLILKALAAGKHVVTANKALLARHGAEIFQAADDAGRDVIFEASVGGGIPIIRSLREGLASDRIDSLHGIINGTSNFILSAMSSKGRTYASVLAEAQERGYAEADPTMDVQGIDAAQKLSILASIAFGAELHFDDILTEGIDRVSALDIDYARRFGFVIKPLAVARAHREEGSIEARVHPALVPEDSMLAAVNGVFNAVMAHSHALGPVLFYGQGAGMMPTAAAVVSDVIETGRNILRGTSGRLPHLAFHSDLVDAHALRASADTVCPYYLRFSVMDQPGVLAAITGQLGARDISISQMIQQDPSGSDHSHVSVVMMTHAAREGALLEALEAIDALPFVVLPARYLRVEDVH